VEPLNKEINDIISTSWNFKVAQEFTPKFKSVSIIFAESRVS